MKTISPDWDAPPNVRAFFTTRQGGRSAPPYHSLNLALHVDDEPELVERNRALLNLPARPVWLNQTHSNRCIDVDTSINLDGDAAVTRRRNVPLAVMVADCVPVLVTSMNAEIACVIHAGWKGLANGIIKATLDSVDVPDLVAWIGPSISQDNYQVGQDVRDCFDGDLGFSPDSDGRFKMNLSEIAAKQLSEYVPAISAYDGCTYADEENFFSYRRDGVCGRMAGLIFLTD